MNEITCGVCMDLLPLVRDGIASEESRAAVTQHTASCAQCAALAGGSLPSPPPAASPEHMLRSLRRQMRLLGAFVLLLCVAFGAALTNTGDMFYNSLLMPLIGALGFGVFRIHALYKVPLLILIVNMLGELFQKMHSAEAFDGMSVILWSILYSLFALVGALVLWLVSAALRRKPMRRTFRAGALVAAVLLTVGLCMAANDLVGNPVSFLLARRAAQNYLNEHYADTDYALDGISFSFKTKSYFAYASAPDSADRYFTLWLDGWGHVQRDDYRQMVEEGDNTARRLSADYRAWADAIMALPSWPYESEIAFGELTFLPSDEGKGYGIDRTALVPDGEYDIPQLGAQAGHLTVYVEDENVTAERAAEILLDIRRLMDAGGLPFYSIDFVLEYPHEFGTPPPDLRLDLLNFLYKDIFPDSLTDRVTSAAAETQVYYEAEYNNLKGAPPP